MLKNKKERLHYLRSSNNWTLFGDFEENIRIQKLLFVNLYRLLILTNGKYRPYDDCYFKIIDNEIEPGIHQTEAINEIYRTPEPTLPSGEKIFKHYKSVEEHNEENKLIERK